MACGRADGSAGVVYEQATLALERCNVSGFEVTQSFQTNATLVNDAWCEFIRRRSVQVGISVDGPDFLNDRHRVTRKGGGTLEIVLRGMRMLRDHHIPFDVITVLTSASLDYPDELFDFYIEHGVTSVAFNVEEIEVRMSRLRCQAAALSRASAGSTPASWILLSRRIRRFG